MAVTTHHRKVIKCSDCKQVLDYTHAIGCKHAGKVDISQCEQYDEVSKPVSKDSQVFDPVNRPAHYCFTEDPAYEPIKVIEAWELGYCLGCCVKYIARAGRKSLLIEDLKKAQWYLNREIIRLEKKAEEDKA